MKQKNVSTISFSQHLKSSLFFLFLSSAFLIKESYSEGDANLQDILKEICDREIDMNEIQNIDFFKSSKDLKVSNLSGGTNRSYKVLFNGSYYYLRIANAENDYIDRVAEFYNLEVAKRTGCIPTLYYKDVDKGILIQKYIEIKSKKGLDNEFIKLVAKQLKKIHSIKQKFHSTKTGQDIMDSISRKISDIGSDIQDAYPENSEDIKKAEHIYIKHKEMLKKIKLVPSHNDFHRGNILCDDKKIYVIDWEISGNNDPAWDLAYFIVITSLNKDQESIFLTAYKAHKDLIERVQFVKPMVNLLILKWLYLKKITLDKKYENDFENLIIKRINILKDSLKNIDSSVLK